jgi:hypothetical protein
VRGWTLEEYFEAIGIDAFWSAVKHTFEFPEQETFANTQFKSIGPDMLRKRSSLGIEGRILAEKGSEDVDMSEDLLKRLATTSLEPSGDGKHDDQDPKEEEKLSGEVLDRRSRVRQKFYFAGFCARFMFRFTVAVVVKTIHSNLDELHDEMLVALSRNLRAKGLKHRLLTAEPDATNELQCSGWVSEYVTCVVSLRAPPTIYLNLMQEFFFENNAACLGWLLEGHFFTLCARGKLRLRTDRTTTEGLGIVFELETVRIIDPTNLENHKFTNNTCFMPIKYNQPGYDAVIRRNENELWFIQVARGIRDKHKLDFGEVAELVKQVQTKMEIHRIEVIFVIPGNIQAQFPGIGEIPGWRKFVEVIKKLTTLKTNWPVTEADIKANVKTYMFLGI